MKKSCVFLLVLSAALLGVAGCSSPTADSKMMEKQETLQAELERALGLPNITRFTEAKRMRYLYELRDRADLTVWIYSRDYLGKSHLIGVGMGYPIPYGTQFSNPQKLVGAGGRKPADGLATIPMPQSEPNGLFMPPTAEASWVILMTKRGPKPFYGESRLEGTPERRSSADESEAIWPAGTPLPPEIDVPPLATEKDIQAVETSLKKKG